MARHRGVVRRWSGLGVAVCVAVLVGSCDGSSSAEDGGRDGDDLLTAADVGGRQTGSGTDLLEPAAPRCDLEGDYLWKGADGGDVRRFERTVDGVAETVVVGAWPMSSEAAEAALKRSDPGPPCTGGDTIVQSVPIGVSDGNRTSSFEVEVEDATDRLTSWQIRTYSRRAEGYMVTVWLQRANTRPSRDGVRELLDAQIRAVGGEP